MSIKINKTVLDKIKKSKKNIEFYGYPDSGCSLTSIAILKLLKEPSVYVNLIYQNHNKQILSKIIGQNTIILLTESYSIEMLSNISKTLSKTVKYAVLDNFSHFILNKPRKEIKKIFILLEELSKKYGIIFIIINQMRHNVLDKQQNSRLVSLYESYIHPHVGLRFRIRRSEKRHRDIYIFCEYDSQQDNKRSSILEFLENQ